jgi:hypothetical protein
MFEIGAVHFGLHAYWTVLNSYLVHHGRVDGLLLEKRFKRSETYMGEYVVITQQGGVKTGIHGAGSGTSSDRRR